MTYYKPRNEADYSERKNKNVENDLSFGISNEKKSFHRNRTTHHTFQNNSRQNINITTYDGTTPNVPANRENGNRFINVHPLIVTSKYDTDNVFFERSWKKKRRRPRPRYVFGVITRCYQLARQSPTADARLVNNEGSDWAIAHTQLARNAYGRARTVTTTTTAADNVTCSGDGRSDDDDPLLLTVDATAAVNVNVTDGGENDDMDVELTKVCRLCLAVADWPVSVLDELADKIAQCLQIRISSADHLPKHVCVKCKDTVNEFHAYYTNTVECQKQLEHLVGAQHNVASSSFEPVVTINYDQNAEYKSEYNEPESWSESNQSEFDSKDSIKIETTDEINDRKPDRTRTPRKIKIKLFKCTKCDESFNTKHALKDHKNDAHPHTAYKCNCCDKTFDTMCARQKHKKEEHPSVTYSCDTCDYRTPYKSRMQYHENRHKKVYSVFCDTCQAGFFNKDELATHEIKNHGAEPYQCDRCSKLCTSKTNLYSHMKVHTTSAESVSYQCETCGKAFRRIGSYRRHIQSHLGLKYECSYCNKLLSSAHHLKLHVRIHTGEKNHVCEMCGKAFTVSKYLVEHKRIHTGERPFKCDLCSKGFTQKTSLRIHTRWHTGDRPYKCDVCDDRFVINTFLQRHIKKHHPDLMGPVQNPCSNSLQAL